MVAPSSPLSPTLMALLPPRAFVFKEQDLVLSHGLGESYLGQGSVHFISHHTHLCDYLWNSGEYVLMYL